MKEIATFEKVSFRQFTEDMFDTPFDSLDEESYDLARDMYDKIKLPERATALSAGYDFYCPYYISFKKNEPKIISTGIRVWIDPGWFLMLLPRSGLGFRFGMRLENTAGVIDSDYYGAKNEGHIKAKISFSSDAVMLAPGTRFMQGIFIQCGRTRSDQPVLNVRNGGFGSTGGLAYV